ncbi:hypothetical protein QEN19_004075 [Hanseniaspora menglaensis]
MEQNKAEEGKINLIKFSQNFKRSLNELRNKHVDLKSQNLDYSKSSNDNLGVKEPRDQISSQSGKEDEKYGFCDVKYTNADGVYESPTKKRKASSRLTKKNEFEGLKRSLSFSSDKSTSDDDENEIIKENIGLATLTSKTLISEILETKEKLSSQSPLELDCRDEFMKRCNFISSDNSNLDVSTGSSDKKSLLHADERLLLISSDNLSPVDESDKEDEAKNAKKKMLKNEPEKEIGADLLLYLASSPSSSQKKPAKQTQNKNSSSSSSSSQGYYSLNIPSSQSILLNNNNNKNSSNKSNYNEKNNSTESKNSKSKLSTSEINKSAPSTLLDYDGNTMLTSHLTENSTNNNIPLQYMESGRFGNNIGNNNDSHNKYKLLSTPVTKNRDFFGHDSSILRYATMSGGSVVNSGINSNYNDIPDVVLLNSRIDLSERINDLNNSKSRVIDDDISLRGLDETSDEDGESNPTARSHGNIDFDTDDDKNRLFKTPNISHSGVMSHVPNSMIDSIMLNSVADAIHFGPKSASTSQSPAAID